MFNVKECDKLHHEYITACAYFIYSSYHKFENISLGVHIYLFLIRFNNLFDIFLYHLAIYPCFPCSSVGPGPFFYSWLSHCLG